MGQKGSERAKRMTGQGGLEQKFPFLKLTGKKHVKHNVCLHIERMASRNLWPVKRIRFTKILDRRVSIHQWTNSIYPL
jgi:hypothetical protein